MRTETFVLGLVPARKFVRGHNFPGDNLSKALLTVAQIMRSNLTEIGIDAGRDHVIASGHPGLSAASRSLEEALART